MKDKKVKLKIIIEYNANPEYYETNDPIEMARIDAMNFNEDPHSLEEFLMYREDYIVKVEPA